MNITNISYILNKFNLRIPEVPIKEEFVRFLTEKNTERIVEIPFVLSNINKKKQRVLDIGCRYNLLSLQLASLGNKVTGVDIIKYNLNHPNFRFRLADITTAKIKANYFDIVISLSTIEHIGLGFYKDKQDLDGDKKAVASAYNSLKQGGMFLLTVPFGNGEDSTWYRVYNLDRLNALVSKFRQKKIEIYCRKGKYWIPINTSKAQKIISNTKVSAVACLKAVK